MATVVAETSLQIKSFAKIFAIIFFIYNFIRIFTNGSLSIRFNCLLSKIGFKIFIKKKNLF